MKIVTWNVKSIRARLNIVQEYLEKNQPDIMCIQETKVTDDLFPESTFKELGYYSIHSGQKSYNGVAIVSKFPFKDVKTDLFDTNGQKRTVQTTINNITIINTYFPRGGGRGEEKFFYKLEFFQKMKNYIETSHAMIEKLALVGDFNVAPESIDVWDSEELKDEVGFMKEEREAFKSLMEIGLIDLFRALHKEEKIFSWWDYRGGAFRRNWGMRIDHILVTPSLKEIATDCLIDITTRKLKKPSDHAPVIANFALS